MTALGDEWVVRNRGDMGTDLGIHGRKEHWRLLQNFMEKGFRLKSRDEWAELFYGENFYFLLPVMNAGLTLLSY